MGAAGSQVPPRASQRSPASHRGRGYTLIELMAVLMILAMVMGVAMTSVDSTVPRFEIDAQANDMALALRDARNRAMIAGRAIRLELYPDAFQMQYFFEEPAPSEDPLEFSADEPFRVQRWSKHVILDRAMVGRDEALIGQAVVLKFWPTGLCTPVRLYLYHKKSANQKRTVRLNPLTGLTKVYPGHVEPESYELRVTAPARER